MGSPVLLFRSPPTPLGESPPPAPRACFGRDGLIETVVGLAENIEPIALIGAGVIGKTFVALTVLHHKRIKERFGENRRFIRCDQFPASCAHLLVRLSKVIGAGVGNPEDLAHLRPFLSSKEILIVLDNAKSILDPKGTDAEEIYSVVDELCQFETVCLCITSRITTVPPYCRRPEILTLSMEAAANIFYRTYGEGGRSGVIDDLLRRLDFHALSITLLATAASHNAWDHDRLAKEWDTQRAQVLQTDHNKSLAATIELSLCSSTFRSLGPNARELLGVVAFFPQGIDQKNLDWLFPTISDRKDIFDKFCVLSLTYRSNDYITMLAPIRDHLGPQDPRSSPLLCATRDHYFSRLSVDVNPGSPGYEEARWIVSEDVNVEHLLDVFVSIDPGGRDIWDVCSYFMSHLYWYKPRPTMLGSKIEALPEDHRSKSICLVQLSRLLGLFGNLAEQKRLLAYVLKLERRRGDDSWVAYTLQQLSGVNQLLEFYEEGIQQAEEALEIYGRIGGTLGQGWCLNVLASLMFYNKRLDAAEKAASRAIDLATEGDQQFLLSSVHQTIGSIYHAMGEKKKGIHHFETSIKIASSCNLHNPLFWAHYSLAELFRDKNEFDDAHTHVERAKSHTGDEKYKLGRAMQLQANILLRQVRLEDAKSEALCALDIYEKFGAAHDAGICRELLQSIKVATENRSTTFQSELLEKICIPRLLNPLF